LKARNFTDAEWQAGESDSELIKSVTEGKDDMPPFGKKLTAEQIQSLVKNDVRGFAPKKN
jgi:mono/diheme cytochrome c family protein